MVLIFAVRFQTPKIQHLSLRSAVRSLDATGMMLLISCLTLLIVALNIGGDAYPWDSKVVIGLFVGSAFAFLLFIVAENFASFSIVPMGLFASWEWRNVPIMTGEQYDRYCFSI